MGFYRNIKEYLLLRLTEKQIVPLLIFCQVVAAHFWSPFSWIKTSRVFALITEHDQLFGGVCAEGEIYIICIAAGIESFIKDPCACAPRCPAPCFYSFFAPPGNKFYEKLFFFLPPRHVIGYSNRFFISFPIVRALILAIVHHCLCGIPISSRNPVAPDPWALTLENDHRIAKVTATHA